MELLKSFFQKMVKREGAERYLLYTLLSFAASVSLTRLFLAITGYPQLGGGNLHIAHVLWGGLLLFVAALLPLIVANRWIYGISAISTGVGVGLFIDEIGKFITSNNNYFYPFAAPIIYVLFLLIVLLYIQVRQPVSQDARTELYSALEIMEEILEYDLDPQERSRLTQHLKNVAHQTDQPELARLAQSILVFIESGSIKLAPIHSSRVDSLLTTWKNFEKSWITKRRLKAFLAGGLSGLSVFALYNIIISLPIGENPTSLERILTRLIEAGQINSTRGLNWFAARLALETSVGLLLLFAAGLLIKGRDRAGVSLSYLGLLLSLTTVNLLVFYFDQFSTIVTATIQFILLLGTIYYRKNFLVDKTAITKQTQEYNS
jgi:hypothetical protein